MPVFKYKWGNGMWYYQYETLQSKSNRFYFFDKDTESKHAAMKQAQEYRKAMTAFRLKGKESWVIAQRAKRKWLQTQPRQRSARMQRIEVAPSIVEGILVQATDEPELNCEIMFNEFQ